MRRLLLKRNKTQAISLEETAGRVQKNKRYRPRTKQAVQRACNESDTKHVQKQWNRTKHDRVAARVRTVQRVELNERESVREARYRTGKATSRSADAKVVIRNDTEGQPARQASTVRWKADEHGRVTRLPDPLSCHLAGVAQSCFRF